MTKKVKILIALLGLSVLAIAVLAIGCVACFFFFRKANNRATVFSATAVGKAFGDKVTQEIGPAGGSLSTSDGRITVNVPPDAVSAPLDFSIQPITNTADDGLGSAYRMEPSGHKFAVPVEVLFQYTDAELGETVPEGLLAVYQDIDGSWRSLPTIFVDTERKILIAAATHFTDIGYKKFDDPNYGKRKPRSVYPSYNDLTFLERFHVSPDKATIHINEPLPIKVTGCEGPNLWERYTELFDDHSYCYFTNSLNWHGQVHISFSVEGNIGYVQPYYITDHTVYSGFPTAQVVKVFADGRFIPDDKGTVQVGPNERVRYGDDFHHRIGVTEITILDWGYKVTGIAGDLSFTGVICDRTKPFTIKANSAFHNDLLFTPSSKNTGTWKFTMKGGVTGGGSGSYTIEGIDLDPKITVITKAYVPPTPKILISGDSTGCIHGKCASGGGSVRFDLTPLTSGDGECGQ